MTVRADPCAAKQKRHLARIIPKTKPIISAARILHIPTKPGLRDVVEFRAHYEGIKPIIKRASSLNSSPPKQRGFASFYTHIHAHQSPRVVLCVGWAGMMRWAATRATIARWASILIRTARLSHFLPPATNPVDPVPLHAQTMDVMF